MIGSLSDAGSAQCVFGWRLREQPGAGYAFSETLVAWRSIEVKNEKNQIKVKCQNLKQPRTIFHACGSLQGWEGCKGYVADGARFSAQSEPLIDIGTIEE